MCVAKNKKTKTDTAVDTSEWESELSKLKGEAEECEARIECSRRARGEADKAVEQRVAERRRFEKTSEQLTKQMEEVGAVEAIEILSFFFIIWREIERERESN